jgi:hypothetical protein
MKCLSLKHDARPRCQQGRRKQRRCARPCHRVLGVNIVVAQRPWQQTTGATGRRDSSMSEETGWPTSVRRRGSSWPTVTTGSRWWDGARQWPESMSSATRGRWARGFEGREGTDRWAPSGSDRSVGNGNGLLAREIGLGGTVTLGRCGENGPRPFFQFNFLLLFWSFKQVRITLEEILRWLRKIWNFAWR